jgi:hypothetical protein
MDESLGQLIELPAKKRKEYCSAIAQMKKEIEFSRESALLIEAVICYMTRMYKLHLEAGLSWNAYKEKMGYSDPTVCRYLNAAKVIESWALSNYSGERNTFFISSSMVKDFIDDRKRKNLPISITSLYKEEKEILPEEKEEKKQDDLFSLHDKITNAGYNWNKESGKFHKPDGEEMSDSELSEFVDDKVGLKLFDETKKVLEPVRRDVKTKIDQFKKYYLAYAAKHHSPKFQKLVAEKHKEIENEVLGILHEVSTMLKPDGDGEE